MITLKTDLLNFFARDGRQYVSVGHFGGEIVYPVRESEFIPRAEAVLMDLDGTTLDSEEFWIYIIERTVCELLGDGKFTLSQGDIPYVSGYTTAEHLSYCINRYCPEKQLSEAVKIYHKIAERELHEIDCGRGNQSAFRPKPDLKEFLTELKGRNIKIGLATSGLDYKAIPEIKSVFRTLHMGDPLSFYDSVITGGRRKDAGEYGTIGEVAAKPHPFIYSELAYMGLKIGEPSKVIGIEDSSAGVLALRLAGFAAIGLNTGNVAASGLKELCRNTADCLTDTLKYIL